MLPSNAGNAASIDPFDGDDWDDDDDIMQLVANEAPTSSQLSQAIKAPIQERVTPLSTNRGLSTNQRSFTFKRPSSATTSLLATKPNSYTTSISSSAKPVTNGRPTTSISSRDPTLVTSQQPSVSVDHFSTQKSTVTGSILSQAENSVDLATLKKQVSDLIRKQHGHEGEIKWLRSTLKEKDDQINKVRTTLNGQSAKLKLQNSERERTFTKDIESLRSELQFKESELINVAQALDKLKREKDKPPPPPKVPLDADGFPINMASLGKSPPVSRVDVKAKTFKAEPMDTDDIQVRSLPAEIAQPSCDLKPLPTNRLIPRKMSSGEYKRKMLVSGMLKSNLENIRSNINLGNESSGPKETNSDIDWQKCLHHITESIECTKDICYI